MPQIAQKNCGEKFRHQNEKRKSPHKIVPLRTPPPPPGNCQEVGWSTDGESMDGALHMDSAHNLCIPRGPPNRFCGWRTSRAVPDRRNARKERPAALAPAAVHGGARDP